MSEDLKYISKVIRRILNVSLLIFATYIGIKLAVFYMPFLIAFILSLIVEPAIKYLMRTTKLNRKVSSIIIFVIVFSIIIGSTVWGVISLISESTNLLQTLNIYIDKAYTQIQDTIGKLNISKISVSSNILNIAENSSKEILLKASKWITQILTQIINGITSIPVIGIYTVITILSLYFICTDKIYILDFMEHHMPIRWVQKIGTHIKEITKSLGGYLKAEAILILVSFVISLIGLYIFKFIGMDVRYPLLMALAIGFVDALPILGSGTVMVPWSIIVALNGDIRLGIAIIVLWIIMSITRQFLEPKIVSGKIGIHPIFTLIAMYTGFKIIGVMGMLVGPIVLIILKNIFARVLDEGVSRSLGKI
ncbi:MAG: sporulation integral membrane protein YtvI [Clostridia bacterium]|nr:sporulation integral membrane protein YtvI [Clostridia bacterium]